MAPRPQENRVDPEAKSAGEATEPKTQPSAPLTRSPLDRAASAGNSADPRPRPLISQSAKLTTSGSATKTPTQAPGPNRLPTQPPNRNQHAAAIQSGPNTKSTPVRKPSANPPNSSQAGRPDTGVQPGSAANRLLRVPTQPPLSQPRAKPQAKNESELLNPLRELVKALEGLDYFQVLGLPITATPKEVKEAYYRKSREYHPDRFCQLADLEQKQQINLVFKRITEAYVVLRDDKKRAKYLVDISGPEREKKLRYTEASDAEQKAADKKAIIEQVGTTPKGRECFKNGTRELESKRFDGAIRQFKMAVMYEPANVKYKEKLKEAETEWDKIRPKNDFRIK